MRRIWPVVFLLLVVACTPTMQPNKYAKLFPRPPVGDRDNETLYGNYLSGRQALIDRDVRTAELYFERAYLEEPDNLAIRERLFVLQVHNGHIDRATKHAEVVVRHNPTHRLARLTLALGAVKRNENDRAREHLEAASGGMYNSLMIDLILTWFAAGEGEVDSAMARLENLNSIARGTVLREYHAALIQDTYGDPEEAERYYTQAIEATATGSLQVIDAYGRFLERQGRPLEAEKIYTEFLSVSPGHPVAIEGIRRIYEQIPATPRVGNLREGIAEAIYGAAALTAGERNSELPILLLRLSLDLSRGNGEASILLTELFQRRGQYDEAARASAEVAADSPLAGDAVIKIADNLYRLKRVDDAIKVLEDVISIHPDQLDAYMALGDILRSESRFEESLTAYDRALAILGRDRANWVLLYSRGISLERTGRWKEAEADLLLALRRAPNQPFIMNYIGYSWIDRGVNIAEALEMLQTAYELAPGNGAIVDSLGWAYFKNGDYQRAVYYLEKAIELEPEDATINDHLGDAYWMVGRKAEAKFQWKHALDRNPDEALALKLEHKLANGLNGNANGNG